MKMNNKRIRRERIEDENFFKFTKILYIIYTIFDYYYY